MTEPIPALVYHQPTLSRRPGFIALAILATVFGLLGAIMAAANSVSYLNVLSAQTGASATSLRFSIVPTIVSEIVRAPAYLCLSGAGVAFLSKSRWTTGLLCGYLCVSLLATFAWLVASSLVTPPMGMPVMAMTSIGRSIPAIARATFDVAVLLLLLNKTVQALILQASGAGEALLPDVVKAG